MKCQEAGDAMRVCRRTRATKIFAIVLAFPITLYLLLKYEPVPIPILISKPLKAVYDLHPTYEYESLYRTRADHAFEVDLESKLVFLEKALRINAPKDRSDVIANRTIWQSTTTELAGIWSSWVTQWRYNNEDWKHKLYTSPPADLLPLFETVPDIGAANTTYPEIRNDLFRYLLLWYHGGAWSEIDTWNRVAMRNCQPILTVLENKKNVSLMVGIDVDEPYFSQDTIKAHKWSRGFGFSQSTIWAPKRFDPILRKAIVRSISHAMVHATLPPDTWKQKLEAHIIAHTDYGYEVSGAGMFTDLVLEMLSQNLKDDHLMRDRDAGLERRVTWKHFRKRKQVLWIEPDQMKESVGDYLKGIAVLPIDVWGSGQSHSGSGSSESDQACVNHVHNWRPQKQWKHRIFG
jgi:alpha 1,6-mannosyltransferase